MFKRILLGMVAVAIGGVFLVAGASPAAAQLDGPCAGSAKFEKGAFTVNATETGVVTVPEKDTVTWEGSLTTPPADETPYSGEIRIELPPPLDPLVIDDWSGTSNAPGNNGTKKYDIPSYVPRGVELEVTGFHNQGAINCSGSVKFKIDGSSFGIATAAGLGLTVLTGAGLFFAGRAR